MRVLDLFSGIGGFSLGLERAGMRTVAFCEIDPFCREVLAKHWPNIPCHDDVRTMEFPEADVICGGFPCQDISNAGKCAGLAGERSGLWRELLRAIRLVRPLYAIVENVAALLGRGMGTVLGDLAEIGYDAEWHCIPASAVGAPHRRDRVWIVAYASCERRQQVARGAHGDESSDEGRAAQYDHQLASDGEGCRAATLADAIGARLEGRSLLSGFLAEELAAIERGGEAIPDADCEQTRRPPEPRRQCGQWLVEPDVGRVAHGIPSRVDRLRSLGNAVVPQIPEMIGRAIMTDQTTNQRKNQ